MADHEPERLQRVAGPLILLIYGWRADDHMQGHSFHQICTPQRREVSRLEGSQLVVGARAKDDHAQVGREVHGAQSGKEFREEVGEAADLAQPSAHQHGGTLCARQRPCGVKKRV